MTRHLDDLLVVALAGAVLGFNLAVAADRGGQTWIWFAAACLVLIGCIVIVQIARRSRTITVPVKIAIGEVIVEGRAETMQARIADVTVPDPSA